ncbi:MAG: acetolactate synthase [Gemmataceae bacterium]
MSFGDESNIDFATARGRDWPSVRQFNVFLANRVGALVNVIRCFENTDVRIVSMTIVDTADCAIVRMVLSDTERGIEIFERAKLMYTESDLLVVQLPDGKQPLLQIAKAILAVELSIHYAYPLLIGPHGTACLAIHVDNYEFAAQTLAEKGFTLYTENDLNDSPPY